MSQKWATIAGHSLYFYAAERHQRPHVDVRGPEGSATLDINTGEVLSGQLPPRVRRAVQTVLVAHRARALDAFRAALDHRPLDSLERRELEDDDD